MDLPLITIKMALQIIIQIVSMDRRLILWQKFNRTKSADSLIGKAHDRFFLFLICGTHSSVDYLYLPISWGAIAIQKITAVWQFI